MVLEMYIPNQYFRMLVIFIGLLLILRISISILERIILRVVRKSKTELDDIILVKSSKPLTLISFFISLQIALNELVISEFLDKNISLVIYSILVILTGYLIYIWIDILVFEIWSKFSARARIKTGKSLASLIQGVLKITAIVLIFLYVLDLWGVEITPLLAGLGLAGLAIALALQPILGNIFSGIAIIMDKTVRVGDLIYLDKDTKGKIEKIGLRSTQIKTFDNELLIIPNTKLAESNIQNVALPEPKTRVVIPFGVAYGSDIEKVKKIVIKEIKTIKKICKKPEPFIAFLEMADSSLNLKAYFHVESFEDRLKATDEANTKIYNILNKNKIEIPFPQMDVHVKKK